MAERAREDEIPSLLGVYFLAVDVFVVLTMWMLLHCLGGLMRGMTRLMLRMAQLGMMTLSRVFCNSCSVLGYATFDARQPTIVALHSDTQV